MCSYQLLRHIDPRHVSTRANEFTEGITISAGAAAEVQHSAALELRGEGKAAPEESGGWEGIVKDKSALIQSYCSMMGCVWTLQRLSCGAQGKRKY